MLTAPATAPEGRLRFEVMFEDEETGGGKAVALAEELQQEGEVYILIGGVEIYYQDVKITADRAELDRDTKVVTAIGNIIVDQGPSRLTGATASFNLDDKTGVLTAARGYVSTDYFFSGAEVRKTGDRTYTVIDGVFTSCAQDVPPWSFRAHRTNIVVDGYARTHGASMRVRNVPVIYFPYMLWPVKPERSSGFLVPKPGYSARRGASLGLAYYQTIGPSFDTTVNVDLFSRAATSASATRSATSRAKAPAASSRATGSTIPISTKTAGASSSTTSRRTCRWGSAASSPTRTSPTSTTSSTSSARRARTASASSTPTAS